MTAQAADLLIFEGRQYGLSCEPLTTWLWRRKNKSLRFQRMSTAVSRGYLSSWEINRGRLYLSSIRGTLIDGEPATLDSLFVNYSKQYLDSVGANDESNQGPGAFAFWVTGTLVCSFGNLLWYEHAGYESIHEFDLHLWVVDGFLRGTRIVQRQAPRGVSADDPFGAHWDEDDFGPEE